MLPIIIRRLINLYLDGRILHDPVVEIVPILFQIGKEACLHDYSLNMISVVEHTGLSCSLDTPAMLYKC